VIALEELRPEDFELAAGWLSRKEVNRWLTAEWRDRTVTTSVIAMAVRNRRNRIFIVQRDGRPCGLVCLADIDTSDMTAMVWYLLAESGLSGKGITSEAVRQVTRLAFREMALESVYAWAMQDNAASLRVLEKAGFLPAGRIRRAARSGETQVDRLYFDLVRSDID
jgi:RimJ/RimL family protein N-acetyltransferase